MMHRGLTAFLFTLLLCSSSFQLISCSSLNSKDSSTPTSQAISNEKRQADALHQEGNQLFEKYRWRLALEKYKQALGLYQETGDKTAISATLIQLGLVDNLLRPVEFSKSPRNGVYLTQAVATRKELLEKLKLKDEGNGREFFQEALKIQKESGDRAGQAAALIRLGETYEGRISIPNNILSPYSAIGEAEPETAAKLYEEAISLYKELGDKANQRDALIKLGNLFLMKQGEGPPKAATVFERALDIYPPNSKERVKTLTKLAASDDTPIPDYCSTSQRMEYCQQALEMYRVLGDKTGEQDLLSKIVLASARLSDSGQIDATSSEANKIFQQSLDQANTLYQINADKEATREVLLELAGIYYPSHGTVEEKEKAYSQIRKFLDRAVEIYRNSGDQKGVADTLLEIVQFHTGYSIPQQQRFTQPLLKDALAIYRKLGDKQGEARALSLKGMIIGSCNGYFLPGARFGDCKPEQALNVLQQPLELYRQLDDRTGEAQTLSDMAANYEMMTMNRQNNDGEQSIYKDPAKANQALKLYQQALDIYTSTNDKTGKQQTLLNMAVIHQNLKQVDQAKELYHQVLTLADGETGVVEAVVCTVDFDSIQEKEFLDANGYLSVGDYHLRLRGLCSGGGGGRASLSRTPRR